MAAQVISGIEMAQEVRAEVSKGVQDLIESGGPTPGLAAVLVGDDPASAIYVRNKRRACNETGIFSETFAMPATTSEADVISLVDELNRDQRFHGILVQLLLPEHICLLQ